MSLFYSFFDERAGITGSKAVEEVGKLTTPCLWGYRARKNILRSRGVQTCPCGSRLITQRLRRDGGTGGAAARRRSTSLLQDVCERHKLFSCGL